MFTVQNLGGGRVEELRSKFFLSGVLSNPRDIPFHKLHHVSANDYVLTGVKGG